MTSYYLTGIKRNIEDMSSKMESSSVTATTISGYDIYEFTSDGTFIINNQTSTTPVILFCFMAGGGGAGGSTTSDPDLGAPGGGGGGAGGFYQNSIIIPAGKRCEFSVFIGTGGIAESGTAATNTYFTVTNTVNISSIAYAGGLGGSTDVSGNDGGSGGGAGSPTNDGGSSINGGNAYFTQGNNGGISPPNGRFGGGGGGGGALSSGGFGIAEGAGGSSGDGAVCTLPGISSYTSATYCQGGQGGGYTSSDAPTTYSNTNTGNGGGGANGKYGNFGGNGDNGIAIFALSNATTNNIDIAYLFKSDKLI